MTNKRFYKDFSGEYGTSIRDRLNNDEPLFIFHIHNSEDLCGILNELSDENKQLKQVIAENEKLIQSTYDELTKLRCIKKNLSRIKDEWNWIMKAIDYD